MTSSNGNIYHATGPLCREFTGHRWISLTKASDAELWWIHWSSIMAYLRHISRMTSFAQCQTFNFNTSEPRQNCRYFVIDIFKFIFGLMKNMYFDKKNCLKFVLSGPINDNLTLVQKMVCRLFGDKPLSETMVAWFTDTYMRHSASMI